MRRCLTHSLSILWFTPVLTACAGGDTAAVRVERTDSAGVELVRSLGDDVALDWSFDTVLTLGGADSGPQAFHRVSNAGIDTDAEGNIYVLDGGNSQVQVFAADGTHLRTLGRRGEGPGELGPFLYSMDAAPDGGVAIFDAMKRSLVRWDPHGQVLPSIPVAGQPSSGVELLDANTAVAAFQDNDFESDSARYVLRILRAGGGSQDLLSMVREGMRPVDFDCVRISSMTPLFQPGMEFSVAGGAFVVAREAAYRVEIRTPDGALRRIVSRDIPLVDATAELAAIESDSMTVSFGDGRSCVTPAAKVVEQRGFEPVIPAVRQLAGTPGGGVWVQRGYGKEQRVIDVFDPDGAYTGTLPAGTPWPAAFLDEERVLVRTTDEYDREMVEVRRIARGS